ncbi:MAG: DUF5658 family protein [Sedimentibacter sp.]
MIQLNYILKSLTISKKLLLIYVLNISDVIFTIFLINSTYFVEANPLLAAFSYTPHTMFLFKAIVPGLLLLFVYIIINHISKKQFTLCNKLINFSLIAYTLVNILHLVCVSYLQVMA